MSENRGKILYLSADSGVPYWGTKGGSIHIREIVNAMIGQGYQVSVVAGAGDDENREYSPIEIMGLPRVDDDPFLAMTEDLGGEDRLYREMMEYYRNARLMELLLKLDSRSAFDYVYERYSLFSIAGLRFARKRGIPFMLEVNAPLVAETSRYRRLVFADLAISVENYLFNGADHIVTVSDELKRYILDIAPEAGVSVIPNGARIEHFQNAGRSEPVDLPAGLEDSDYIVGFVGSLKPWHGVEILIDSFAEFAAQSKGARLLIIGGRHRMIRPLEKKCHRLGLDGRVIFTGALPYEAIPPLLQLTDVLAAPYPKLPGFYFSALKIFEYMAAGKAIIASDIGQIPEILTHEETALLVPPGDGIALRDAIHRLSQDSSLRGKLSVNALAEVREKHTWGKRAEAISGIMASLKKTERTAPKS